jgi:hypothetical protein
MGKYGIKALFYSNNNNENTGVTYYDEVTFNSEEEAIDAICGEYGDLLVAVATIDCENEEDLEDTYFGDLEPYLISEGVE